MEGLGPDRALGIAVRSGGESVEGSVQPQRWGLARAGGGGQAARLGGVQLGMEQR